MTDNARFHFTECPQCGDIACRTAWCPDEIVRYFCSWDCADLWRELYYVHKYWEIRATYQDPVAQ